MYFCGIAEEMFPYKEEIEEIRVLTADHVKPGERYYEKKRYSRQVKGIKDQAPFFCKNDVPENYPARKDYRYQAFCKQSQGCGSVKGEEPPFVVFDMPVIKGRKRRS